jgi:hypothetical protein
MNPSKEPPTINEDELLLAYIHCAHNAKCRAKIRAALQADYPLTAEHKRALADMEVPMRPRTKHDRGRKKALPLDGSETPPTMNKDELLLADIHCAHHAKCCANVRAALQEDYPLTAEHKWALADMKVPMRPRTKHDRGRKKAVPLDGSETDHRNRAIEEVRETAKNLKCGQRLALELLAGPRASDYPKWDAATRTKMRAQELGIWKARAATLTTIYGKQVGDRYDWSRFADRIAAKLHLD